MAILGNSTATSLTVLHSVTAGSFVGPLEGTATNATNAVNLTAAPSLAASGQKITVTAGGKTSAEFTVPFATSSTSASSAGRLSSSSPMTTGHTVYYYSGQPTIGTASGNAAEGSNDSYTLWSYPKNGTALNSGTTANVQTLRLQWGSTYLHDIFVSPNYRDVWHRWINNGKGKAWSKFVMEDTADENVSEWNITAKNANNVPWSGVSGKPALSVEGHTHTKSQITDFAHTHDYLPLTGGTLAPSSNNTPLTVKGTTTAKDSWIAFHNNDGFLASVGVDSSKNFRFYNGTSYKVWHEGNDGSGSGLDADKLDGKEASAFATADHTTPAFTGATSSANGTAGHVPAPTSSQRNYYLKGDGTWASVSNTIPAGYCTTAADTAAKAASYSGYVLRANSYFPILFSNTNSAASAITLNINSKGAKPIFLNGTASSATNYTLPAGQYIAYYNGTNYYINTDGTIPNISSSSHTHAYLPLGGGSLTGKLSISSTNWGNQLSLTRTSNGSNWGPTITFYDENGGRGAIMMENNKLFVSDVAGTTSLRKEVSTVGHTHSKSNITDFDHTHEYLPLTGGTLTGTTSIQRPDTAVDCMLYAERTDMGKRIGFGIGTSNNRGIYDAAAGGWILRIATDNSVSLLGNASSANTATKATNDSDGNSIKDTYLKRTGGSMTGNLLMSDSKIVMASQSAESKGIQLRSQSANWHAGIGYDRHGDECIAMWAKNRRTNLRFHSGVDFSEYGAFGSGTEGATDYMLAIDPVDFEITHATTSSGYADGEAIGYIGGNEIITSATIANHITAAGGQSGEYLVGSTGNIDANTVYDFKYYGIQGGSNCPPNSSAPQYGSLLTLPYRQMKGNASTDFATQIFIPNGDTATANHNMYYRTSTKNSSGAHLWNAWRTIIDESNIFRYVRPVVNTTASTITLQANKYYKRTSAVTSEINISLAANPDSASLNEYFIEFEYTNGTITLPGGLKWLNENTPIFRTGYTYQISIVNNLAICLEFK